ncbi:MAG: HAD family hydrolase [Clostridia bacterium]|nr:HAD family hydrolase [Clostridia bacterium]
MKPYRCLIFDVDDTLLDFSRAYKDAQHDIARRLGVAYTQAFAELDDRCGWQAWVESRLDQTDSSDVQANYHEYYMRYVEGHYTYLLRELGMDIDRAVLTDCYLKSVTASRVPMEEDTLRVCRMLSERYRIALATNGLTDMQRERVKDFLPFTHKLYISEAIGHIKPTVEFFGHMLADLGYNADECLMIGDSVTNDIIGAKAAGMDVCFYNKRGKKLPEDVTAEYEIQAIGELEGLLRG